MYHPTVDPNDAEMQAGQELVRAAGAAKLAQEKAEAEAKEKAAWAEVDAQLQAAEVEALALYRECKPLYDRRARAAEQLRGPLAEFMAAENEIRSKLDTIGQVLAELRSRVDPVVYRKHTDRLRAAASLPEHNDIGIDPESGEAGQLTQTVAGGIVRGHIFAGGIRVRNVTVNLGKQS